MPTIPNFPQHLAHEHHAWHDPRAHPGLPTRNILPPNPGSGLEFLTYHRDFMARFHQWYDVQPFAAPAEVAPWTSVPGNLKTANLGWTNQWASDEQRLASNNPPFASADDLGLFIERGIHNQFLHSATSQAFNEPLVRNLHSPESTLFYKIHGLVDFWWNSWETRSPTGPAAQGDDMQPGEVLNPDQSITSADGRYRFIYQGDGNLVLYDGGRPLWASNTDGKPVGVCIMQGDGNLVIYGPGGQYVWDTATDGNPGSRLVVQSDGNVVIYRPDGTPAWATNTWIPIGPAAQGDVMQPGGVLNPDQSITSANGRYRFIYQGDGNLVLYDGGRPLWASNTDGKPVGVCIMQGDGNLVIYGPGGQYVWDTATDGNPGSRLVVQSDGNVVIYRSDGTPAWATNTVQP